MEQLEKWPFLQEQREGVLLRLLYPPFFYTSRSIREQKKKMGIREPGGGPHEADSALDQKNHRRLC